MKLRIRHRTVYAYEAPIRAATQILRLRPREDVWARLAAFELELHPDGRVRWVRDAWGNLTALWDPRVETDRLVVEARSVVDSPERNPFDFMLEPRALKFPVAWNPGEERAFARCLDPGTLSGSALTSLSSFARECAREGKDQPLGFLLALNRTIHGTFRFAQGTTTVATPPDEVLIRRAGVCQDFANLFLACARLTGLPTRYVSGYVYEGTTEGDAGRRSASHAWVEAYLPGAGWIGFDPTNGVLACETHVAAAVGWEYADVAPVAGGYFGATVGHTLEVEVKVDLHPDPAPVLPG